MRLAVWACLVAALAVMGAGSAPADANVDTVEVEGRVEALEAEVSELRALAKSLLASRQSAVSGDSGISSSHARQLQSSNRTNPAVVFKVRSKLDLC